MGDKQLNIIIKAKDMASAALQKIGITGKQMGTDVKAGATQAADGVNKVNNETKKAVSGMSSAWGDAKKAVTDFAKTQAGQLLGGLTIYDIVKKAVTSLYNAIKQGITDAVNKAADLQKMQVLVEAAGDSWADMKPKIDKTFESIKAVTAFSGGELRSAFSRMTLLIGDANVANQQMALAADMASSGLFDLESASQAISMAFEGNVGRLGRLLPELRNMDAVLGENASRAEKAEFIIGKLQDRFGGLATDLESDRESLDQFARAFKELKTNAMEPALPIIGELAKAMDGLNKAMDDDNRGKVVQFWDAMKRGWKDLTPGSKIITTLIAATGVGAPGVGIGLASRGGRKEAEDKMFSRINTRNAEYVKLYNKAMSGDSMTAGELKRLKHLQILYEETNAVTEALKKHTITQKEALKAYEQLSQAQYLRGNIVKKLGLGGVEDEATKDYNKRRSVQYVKEAKSFRDKQLKDLKETGRQLQLTDKKIADRRLEIYQEYYDSVKAAMGLKGGATESAAKDLIKYRTIAESYGTQKKEKDDYLSTARAKIEGEILDKKLKGNEALEYERIKLLDILKVLKSHKDTIKEQVEVKKRIAEIEQQSVENFINNAKLSAEEEIANKRLEGNDALKVEKDALESILTSVNDTADTHEKIVDIKKRIFAIDKEIAKNTEEMWKKSDEEDRKRGEEELKQRAEKIKNIQDAGEFSAETRIINARATGLAALRIRLDEHKKILEQLKSEEANEQLIAEWTNKIKKDEWDIVDAKKEILNKQKEQFGKALGKAFQPALDLYQGGEDRQKAIEQVEKDYQQALDDIQMMVRIANQTGEKYDPLQAKSDADKRRLESLRGLNAAKSSDEQAVVMSTLQAKMAAEEQAQYEEIKSGLSNAISTGIDEGAESGFKSLVDTLKNKIKAKISDALAESILTGNSAGFAGLLGMGGTGKQVPTGGGFAQGWGAMASQIGGAATGGGKGGGLLSFLGLGGGAGGAGIMGAFSSIMPWLGVASLIGGFSKHKSVAQSGTQAIFDTKPTVRGTDTGALMSSDIFQRAMFSSRNKGNALLASTMAGRTGERNINITLKTEKGFSAKVEADMAAIVKSNSMRGVHRRTNFEHQ